MNNMSDAEKKIKLVDKGMAMLAEFIAKKVPESGCFDTINLNADYPGTDYKMMFSVEDSGYSKPSGRCIKASMRRKDSDRLVSHYLYSGTNAQLITWLKNTDNAEHFLNSFEHLQNSVE